MVSKLARTLSAQPWTGYGVALVLTALVTGLIAVVREFANVANISILYLIAVLVTAVLFGSLPAVFASVAAFIAFDFFFVQPTHRFTVSNSEEWLALGVLLVTGVITGELAAALRRRAREAERRRREAVVLYDVVRLMQAPDLRAALTGDSVVHRYAIRVAQGWRLDHVLPCGRRRSELSPVPVVALRAVERVEPPEELWHSRSKPSTARQRMRIPTTSSFVDGG